MESLLRDHGETLNMCRQYGLEYTLIDSAWPEDVGIE